ncbi:MAG: DUF692 domain-containing protein [Rhodospirillales bacterium]|nr:DUF692 domain-containing protein [Rhodospirillales bacterium]
MTAGDNINGFSRPPHNVPLREAGVGLRSPHYEDILKDKPDIGWIEVHPENYFGGGIHRHYLGKARELYPLSLHAVGLSLGSDQPVSTEHLQQIKELADIYEPFRISDHASWSASGNAHFNDLLPLPYTGETLDRLCDNIQRTQDFLGRSILVENPSTYIAYRHNDMSEPEFLNEAASRTGCGLLLDVNNIFVQAHNHGFSATNYIDQINAAAVGEIHLAGHVEKSIGPQTLLIDTHSRYVRPEVWDLYEYTIARLGPVSTLIEWDSELPSLDDLVGEAHKAQDICHRYRRESLSDAAE